MISIVCVFNNETILNNYLLKSLKDQNIDYELILIDNTSGRFKSASEALNYGGEQAKNDYIMFIHQDMCLPSKTWIQDAETILNSLENLGIAGVAGRSKAEWWPITNIKDGIPPKPVAPKKIKNAMKVETLDECLIIIPKPIFNMLKFDETVCDDWHLYSIDYSLSVRKYNYNAYVIPLFAYHRSPGYSFSDGYYRTLEKLLKKHSKDHLLILTTLDNWITFYSVSMQLRFPRIKNIIAAVLRRIKN